MVVVTPSPPLAEPVGNDGSCIGGKLELDSRPTLPGVLGVWDPVRAVALVATVLPLDDDEATLFGGHDVADAGRAIGSSSKSCAL